MRSNKLFVFVLVLCVVVCAGAIGVSSFLVDGFAHEQEALAEKVSMLEEEVGERRARAATERDESAYEVLGVDAERVMRDERSIDSFLRTAFTWDSCAAYDEARETVMSDHGLAEDSQFLSTYMPYVPIDGISAHGQRVPNANAIDAQNLTLMLESTNVGLVSFDRGTSTYGYVAVCEVHSQDGGTRSSQFVIVRLSLDGSGIVDAEAHPATVT